MNFKSIAPLTKFRHNGMRCSAPHHLRDVSFIHITGKLCNMEMQKYQSPPLTTTTTTKEENDTSLNYLIIGFAVIASFALGYASFPFCRYLLRLRKQKTLFFYKEENNDKIMEDFDDDGSTNISNV
uniref:Uncharacterized protein n=1 Tax=Panagrolaimus davidi TaxID=227884 RepID=A0A914PFG7_9BILA